MRAALLALIVATASLSLVPTALAFCSSPEEGYRWCVNHTNLDEPAYLHAASPPPERYDCWEATSHPDCCPLYPSCGFEMQIACYDRIHGPYFVLDADIHRFDVYAGMWIDHLCYYAGCPDINSMCGLYDRLMTRQPLHEIVQAGP